jgi:YbbR domain-containing protein
MLRDLVTHNPWQKFFSLLLAALIWSTVHFGIGQDPRVEDASGNRRSYQNIPITVLTTASDLNRYQVSPTTVSLTLRGSPEILDQLHPSELEVYVNLTENSPLRMKRRIHVNVPPGLQVVLMQPEEVQVEPIASPQGVSGGR